MTRVERINYINEFTYRYYAFMSGIKIYSSSNYNISINPFTEVINDGVVCDKFSSSSYLNRTAVALSSSINALYLQFDVRVDLNQGTPGVGALVLYPSICRLTISTGEITGTPASSSTVTLVSDEAYGGRSSFVYDSTRNTPLVMNPILTNDHLILYESDNGRGLIRNIPYYPNSAMKYYNDVNNSSFSNSDGTFEYYGKLGINGQSYSNPNGTQQYVFAGDNKHPYSTYLVRPDLYNGQILPVDITLGDGDGVHIHPTNGYLAWLMNEFCNDYGFWPHEEYQEQYGNVYSLGIATSASHFYEWLQETKSKLDTELAEYNALPSYTPSTDAEIVDFFNLKNSFDSSFSEYPGIFNSVKLGFGYVTTSDSSNAAKSSLQSGYTHLDKLQETFDKNKLEASISSYIKQVNFSDIIALFDLSETYPGSYTGDDIDGVSSTISFTAFEYRLNYSRFNSASNQLKIIVLFLFLGVKIDYTVPCSSDAAVVMILAMIALTLGRPDFSLWLVTIDGTIAIVVWVLAVILTFGVGGKEEQRIMRSIIIVFAAYLAWQGFFAQTTTSAIESNAAVESGSFTSQLIDGVYYLTPTVKGYISSTALLVGSGFQAMSLDLEFKAEDEDEEQALFEAAYEAKQKEMDEDAKRKDLTLKYKNYKIGANYDKMFAQPYDLKEQKRKEKYDKIYERTFKDRV